MESQQNYLMTHFTESEISVTGIIRENQHQVAYSKYVEINDDPKNHQMKINKTSEKVINKDT